MSGLSHIHSANCTRLNTLLIGAQEQEASLRRKADNKHQDLKLEARRRKRGRERKERERKEDAKRREWKEERDRERAQAQLEAAEAAAINGAEKVGGEQDQVELAYAAEDAAEEERAREDRERAREAERQEEVREETQEREEAEEKWKKEARDYRRANDDLCCGLSLVSSQIQDIIAEVAVGAVLKPAMLRLYVPDPAAVRIRNGEMVEVLDDMMSRLGDMLPEESFDGVVRKVYRTLMEAYRSIIHSTLKLGLGKVKITFRRDRVRPLKRSSTKACILYSEDLEALKEVFSQQLPEEVVNVFATPVAEAIETIQNPPKKKSVK